MKTISLLLILLATTLLPAYSDVRPIFVGTTLDLNDQQTVLPSVAVKPEATAIVSLTKPSHFPTRYDKPQKAIATDGKEIKNAWIPSFPTEFDQEDIGWKITYRATSENGIICLVGTATYTAVNLESTTYGEFTGPIYAMIEGKKYLACSNITQSANVDTSKTHFQIFAKPGQKYTVKLKQLDHWVSATISCAFAEKEIQHEAKIQGKRLTLGK